jgi:mannose-1-phosphate guanylyltransferase
LRIVLLSGGSGKRLWPLSNGIRSKVFLKLLGSEDGGKESMIQRVCRQLAMAGLLSSTTIVTSDSQVEITQSHVGAAIPIISEPCKRGTFTAIALAAAYFHSRLKLDETETICVLPADLFVETAFFHQLNQLPAVLADPGTQLALIGASPLKPSSQYGYIVPQIEPGAKIYRVARFIEKPDEAAALRLIAQGALWNCGIFAFSLKFLLDCLLKKGLPAVYEQLLERYEALPEISFDHEVVEKTAGRVVIPYGGTWNDLGSWEALTGHFASPVIGRGRITADSHNTHLVNELPLPVHVIDVPDVIVAASAEGILVAGKSKANLIKDQLPEERLSMFEEASWGTSRVLDYSPSDEPGRPVSVTRKLELLPGKAVARHMQRQRKGLWTVLAGTGIFTLEGQSRPVQAGDILQIPGGASHGIEAVTALQLIEVQIDSGSRPGEERN